MRVAETAARSLTCPSTFVLLSPICIILTAISTISLKIPETLVAELAAAASRRGVSKSVLVREAIRSFLLAEELSAVERLLAKYRSVPMSLADGCIVRMAEQQSQSVVFTLDSDFDVYRKHRRQRIPLLSPAHSR